jgi:hypothetical protein
MNKYIIALAAFASACSPAPETPSYQPTSPWRVSIEPNDYGDLSKGTHTTRTVSSEYETGHTTMWLSLYDDDTSKAGLSVLSDAEFRCDWGCAVRIRIDGGEYRTFIARGRTDGGRARPDPSKLDVAIEAPDFAALLLAEEIVVEAEISGRGYETWTFRPRL